jgi:hypothetical protein
VSNGTCNVAVGREIIQQRSVHPVSKLTFSTVAPISWTGVLLLCQDSSRLSPKISAEDATFPRSDLERAPPGQARPFVPLLLFSCRQLRKPKGGKLLSSNANAISSLVGQGGRNCRRVTLEANAPHQGRNASFDGTSDGVVPPSDFSGPENGGSACTVSRDTRSGGMRHFEFRLRFSDAVQTQAPTLPRSGQRKMGWGINVSPWHHSSSGCLLAAWDPNSYPAWRGKARASRGTVKFASKL